jgi:hypothetical protein
MALKPSVIYPGQVSIADLASYPYGKAQNDLVEGDGIGTPLEEKLVNEIFGFQQALLVDAGITPSNAPEAVGSSQYLDAIKKIANGALILHRGAQEWQSVQVGGSLIDYPFLVAPLQSSLWFPGRQSIVAVGSNDAPAAVYLRSQDGTEWDPGTGNAFDMYSGNLLQQPVCVAPGAGGEWLMGINQSGDGLVRRVTSHGNGFNDRVPSGATNVTAVHYALGRYLVALGSGVVERSATFTSGWTASSTFASSMTLATEGVPGGEFADDGVSVILLCTRCIFSSSDRFRVWKSTDLGATWTQAFAGDAGITGMNIVWDAAAGKFYALQSNGKLHSSPDGSVWTSVGTTVVTEANGAIVKHGTLAVAGKCLAKLIAPAASASSHYGGILYSTDGGASWFPSLFAKGFGNISTDVTITARDPEALIAANGRFYVSDGLKVFRSGVLAAPTLSAFP